MDRLTDLVEMAKLDSRFGRFFSYSFGSEKDVSDKVSGEISIAIEDKRLPSEKPRLDYVPSEASVRMGLYVRLG